MTNCVVCENLREMERLRSELYRIVDGKIENLCSEEIYEVSKRLDKLIVEHMLCAMKRENSAAKR